MTTTTLDLGPLFDLRRHAAAMTARIGTANEPTAEEVNVLLALSNVAHRSVVAAFAELVVIDDESRSREVDDAISAIGMAIVADDELAIWWDQHPAHLEEQIARMVERMTDEGYSIDEIATTVAMARAED